MYSEGRIVSIALVYKKVPTLTVIGTIAVILHFVFPVVTGREITQPT